MPAKNVEDRRSGDANAKMLSVLAEMGLPAALVSTLLEMGGHEQSLDDARFLRGPIIYHHGPSRWGETIPDWMFDQVRAERTEIATGRLKMPVGPTEIAVVMYPATMEAPLEYHATELYLWASTHAASRHYGTPLAELWKKLNHQPIPDKEVLDPRGQLYHHYTTLAAEIRRKVINAQTARERSEKRQVKEAVQERPARTVKKKAPVEMRPTPPVREVVLETTKPPPRPEPPRKPSSPSPEPGLFSWLLKAILR